MEENEITGRLEKAGKALIKLDRSREAIRTGLMIAAASKPGLLARLGPAAAVLLLAAAMISVYMKVESGTSGGSVNDLGGIWCTYDDSFSGGESKVWPPASTRTSNNFVKSSPGAGGTGYAVRLTGTTGTRLGWDYIGVNTFLSPHSTCPECAGIDLSRFTGVKFKMKGDAGKGRLTFVLPHEARSVDPERGICRTLTGYADYEADITSVLSGSWKDVRVNFRKDLRQPSWAKQQDKIGIETVLSDANIIKWQVTGGGSTVDIWIDKLEFY